MWSRSAEISFSRKIRVAYVDVRTFDADPKREEQIADLLAYGAKLKFLKKTPALTNYQKQLLKIFENKLFIIHPNTGDKKKRYYSKINSFEVIP